MKNTKKWLTALIVFFVFMWICTIISKSIYVEKLPVVTVEKPSQKYIEHTVTADGLVASFDYIPVYTIPGVRVATVLVHEGDYVSVGDSLYCVDIDDVEEIIKDKNKQLNKLRLTQSDKVANTELEKNLDQVALNWANEDLDSFFKSTQLSITVAEDNLRSTQRQLKHHKEKSIDPDDEEMQREYLLTREALEEAVTSAQRELDGAKLHQQQVLTECARDIANKSVPKPSDSTVEIYNIDINSLANDIKRYEKLKENDGVITSAVEGYVTSVNIISGSRTLDTSDLLIADSEQPYIFICDITKEQGKYISLSEEVTLNLNDKKVRGEKKVLIDYMSSNNMGGYTIKCKLDDIKTTPGVSGTFKKSVNDKLYDIVIPVEALNKEMLSTFVYVLRSREGILGTEYYVEKRLVSVSDQNERFAAIEHGISSEDEVIVYSTQKFTTGDVVRKNM